MLEVRDVTAGYVTFELRGHNGVAVVRQLCAQTGMTVLLVEQNVNQALRLGSPAYGMPDGRIVYATPSSDREEIIHHLWGLRRAMEPRRA